MMTEVKVVKDPKESNEVVVAQVKTIQPSSLLKLDMEDSLDFVAERGNTIKSAVNTLRYNGCLHITGVDLNEVSRCLYMGAIKIDDARRVLYADRKSISSVCEMKNLLTQHGLEIESVRIDNLRYYVKARRVKNDG